MKHYLGSVCLSALVLLLLPWQTQALRLLCGAGGGSGVCVEALTIEEIDGSPTGSFTTLKFSNGAVTDNGDGTATVVTGVGGGGDASTNTSTSVDSEIALFSGTGGKTLKRATGTGIPTIASGVLSTPITASAGLAAALSDETGSGAVVFAASPALTTPNLGTPSAATLTNATGLPISTGVSGLASGIATFLATPTSANLIAAVTNETGSGSLVFNNTPTLTTPNLGTPSAAVLTNATGLPLTTGVTGTLPNANTTATSANTASAIVARDASGNFTAGTITAALTGNASTATALASNPTDCSAGEVATAIAASGNLTCTKVKHVEAFTAQTTINVAGATHGLATTDMLIQCWDGGTPRQLLPIVDATVDADDFDVVLTFSTDQTGRCVFLR